MERGLNETARCRGARRWCFVLFSVAACSSAPAHVEAPAPKACPPPELGLTLAASDKVNPAPDGQGRPVQVRAYQLATDARLRSATFEDIWQKDKDALATDLLSVEQYPLFPGERKDLTIKPNPAAHFLALVALFREPQGRDWYLTFELEEPRADAGCSNKKPHLSAWLDRMQIQDGQGRADLSSATAAAPPEGN